MPKPAVRAVISHMTATAARQNHQPAAVPEEHGAAVHSRRPVQQAKQAKAVPKGNCQHQTKMVPPPRPRGPRKPAARTGTPPGELDKEAPAPSPDKDGATAEAARAEEASRQNRNAAGELDKEAPAPSPDKDGAAAEAAQAEEASRQSSPDSQADKEANDPLPISTETGKMAVEHDPNEDKDGNAPAPQAEPQHNVDSKDGTSNETASSNGGGNQVGQAEVDHNTAQQGTAPVTDEPSKD